ncbi:geopeptide radical SAM maturase [Geomesophilobacter sediminis]|uniref:Geopeptide radical SAM maturase n=1 Tax=Geomesophilobacter sediminis TaxID=2798584 RepID=A0A8J7LUT0_9BACT|nr:geopeptide radical SAM maturase [Geomesophilobacter sediminis]MBJ6725009.1 geopeptide radical SAM maturase [Geomesophilobacter sediminis]
MHLSRYIKAYPCPDRPGSTLLFSTKRSSIIEVPDDVLRAAGDNTITGANRDTLIRLGFLVPDPAAERREMRDVFVRANKQRNLYNAVVVLNLDCNLACGYCYEDNFRGNFYMSAETADLLVDTVIRDQIQKGCEVKISFYGGEPLLSLDLIKDIAGRLGTAARQNGTKFSFSMISNGTLLSRPVVEELLPLGFVGAKITLDGPPETHDVSRPFVSGSGSFDAIIDNLAAIAGLITLNLGGNFTRDNYRLFPALLDQLLSKGITPDKLGRLLFVPIIQKSGEKVGDFGNACACASEPWVIEAGIFLREESLKRGFPAPKVRASACTIEYESDVVINYNGALFKCPAFMSNDSLQIGTLKDGIKDYRESHNIDVWKEDRCLDCAYLPLCFGGCRQMTLLRTEKIETVDCRKDYFDKSLERLIRQDLEYRTAVK